MVLSRFVDKPREMYDQLVPKDPNDLWERAGASGELWLPDRYVQEYENDTIIRRTGEISAPDFDLSIMKCSEPRIRELRGEDGRLSGQVYDLIYTLSDSVDRRARLILPAMAADERRASPVPTSGTAFTTTIDGYAGHRSERLAKQAFTPVIQVGCEYSGPGFDLASIKDTYDGAPATAMAKSVQAELVIIQDIIETYQLSNIIIPHGDSRGSISAFGQAAMADAYGLEAPYLDPKAAVLHDRLPFEQWPKGAKWLSKELTLGGAVLGKMMAQQNPLPLASTVTANPRFWISSMRGIAPALLAGETGEFIKRLPPEVYACVVGFGKDELYDAENFDRGLSPFDNVYQKVVPKGIHMNLMSDKSTGMQVDRIAGVVDQLRCDTMSREVLMRLVRCDAARLDAQHPRLESVA